MFTVALFIIALNWTQMSTKRWINKYNVVLTRNKNGKKTVNTHKSMNEFQKYFAEQKKSDINEVLIR